MFHVLAVICLAGNALANFALETGPCPEVQTVADFKLDKFMGTWFEVLHHVNLTKLAKCAKDDMAFGENGTISRTITETSRKTGVMVSVPQMVRIVDPAQPAKMKFRKLNSLGESDLWVLETDYVSFAFLYSCMNVQSQHVRQGYYVTRDQNASDALIDKGFELIEKYNFQKAIFARIKQDDCNLNPSK